MNCFLFLVVPLHQFAVQLDSNLPCFCINPLMLKSQSIHLASKLRSGCMNMCWCSARACHVEDSLADFEASGAFSLRHLLTLFLHTHHERLLIRAVHMLPLSHFLYSDSAGWLSSFPLLLSLLDLIWCQGWRSLAPMSHCSAPVALWKPWT